VERDLASEELWAESLARSRARREAAAAAKGIELPSRGLSVAALVAVTGGPVAGVALGKALSGDDKKASAYGSGERPAAVATALERAAAAAKAVALTTHAAPGNGAQASASSTASSGAAAQGGGAAAGAYSASSAAAGGAASQVPSTAPAPARASRVGRGRAGPGRALDRSSDGAEGSGEVLDSSRGGQKATLATAGGGVEQLQSALGVTADGDFGPHTERALKRWQRAHGLAADGVAGQATRSALGIGPGPVLKRDRRSVVSRGARHRGRRSSGSERRGSSGGANASKHKPSDAGRSQKRTQGGRVVALQRALGVTADGDFGPATERALKRWQRAHGLVADGVAGPQTRAALGLGPGRVLKRERRLGSTGGHGHRPSSGGGGGHKRGPRGGGVVALQRALGVTADGDFGPATERALKRWQRAHGLVADGVAGPQTRAALGLGPGRVLKRRGGGGGGGGHRAGGGGNSGAVAGVIAAANAIATKPYRYGGGHGSFQDGGYDCSGSASYALHGGGLLSSPLDSTGFMSYGAPGPGQHITIYANSGHVYMTVDGRRFDTSARWETGSRWTSTSRSSAGYVVRHPPGL
jgi:peptidoglycan hydrolase-like protein with peptidoglycan-binding domain